MKPKLLNYGVPIKEVCTKTLLTHISQLEKQQTESNVPFYFKRFLDFTSSNNEDDVMNKVYGIVTSIRGYPLNHFQRLFMDNILEVLSPVILRHVEGHKRARILRKYNMIEPLQNITHAETGRRIGKTVALCAVATGLLMAVKKIRILYFSLYEKTCKQTCKIIAEYMRLSGAGQNGTKLHATSMAIRYTDADGNVSTIHFFTGQNADVNLYIYLYFIYITPNPALGPLSVMERLIIIIVLIKNECFIDIFVLFIYLQLT